MSLAKVLKNIQDQIDSKEMQDKNETDLKQDIWDILKELQWPNKTTKNEYQIIDGSRPDFALIHPDSQEPLIFIELKRHGLAKLKNSKDQVKGYASNSEVPLIVLTDVETWIFYYKGKLAFETGFSSQSLTKISKQLKEFLEPDRVYRGDVYRSAKGALKKKDNLAKARKRIPAAWRQIIKESNPLRTRLINELREKAGHALGVQDLLEADIVAFLQSLKSKNESRNTRQPRPKSEREQPPASSSVSPGRKAATTKAAKNYPGILVRGSGNKKLQPGRTRHTLIQAWFTGENAERKLDYGSAVHIGIEAGYDRRTVVRQLNRMEKNQLIRFDEQAQRNVREKEIDKSRRPRAGELVVFGKKFPFELKSGADAMVIVLQELQKRKPDLYELIYESDWNWGKTGTRRRIAPSPEELYPTHPHLRKKCKEINNNWFVSTNHDRSTIVKIIEHVTEVAGFEFGKDIIINFDD